MMLPDLDQQKIVPVLAYLQDVLKAVGKFQQAFLPVEAHDGHYGLLITDQGFKTQPLTINQKIVQVDVDVMAGFVSCTDEKWSLSDYSPQRIMQSLREWMARNDAERDMVDPHFITDESQFEPFVAAQLVEVFGWVQSMFTEFMKALPMDELSKLLIYPHHFDLSFGWFAHDDLHYTVGFLYGDETIAEPYFYVTAYPEPADFTKRQLDPPAYWLTVGFDGAVLQYRDIAQTEDPGQTVVDYLRQALLLP